MAILFGMLLIVFQTPVDSKALVSAVPKHSLHMVYRRRSRGVDIYSRSLQRARKFLVNLLVRRRCDSPFSKQDDVESIPGTTKPHDARPHNALAAVSHHCIAQLFTSCKSNATVLAALLKSWCYKNCEERGAQALPILKDTLKLFTRLDSAQRCTHLQVRPSASCDPWHDDGRERRDRPWWPYEHGSRGT